MAPPPRPPTGCPTRGRRSMEARSTPPRTSTPAPWPRRRAAMASATPTSTARSSCGRKNGPPEPLLKTVFIHLVNPQAIPGVGLPAADQLGSFFLNSTASLFGGGSKTYPTPTAPNATLTLGASNTFTASTGVFSTGHVRGEITGNAGGRARGGSGLSPLSAALGVVGPVPAGPNTPPAGAAG